MRAIRRALDQRDLRTSAFTLLAAFLPQILLGPAAGMLVDRWDLRRTMIGADLARAAALVPLVMVDRPADMWIVHLVLVWQGGVQQLFMPAEQAILPSLAGDASLPTANALAGQIRDVARLVGSALGGLRLGLGGLAPLVLFDAASFAASAALLARLAPGVPAARPRPGSGGLRLVRRHPVLRTVAIFLLVTCVGEGVMGTLFAPFVRSVVHGSAAEYGALLSLQAISGIGGGLLAPPPASGSAPPRRSAAPRSRSGPSISRSSSGRRMARRDPDRRRRRSRRVRRRVHGDADPAQAVGYMLAGGYVLTALRTRSRCGCRSGRA
ncbi:MAG TPA: MFS transporter [Solirubrobacter sp.]|nr:MFS transporter [Solirubrobacter sp.]